MATSGGRLDQVDLESFQGVPQIIHYVLLIMCSSLIYHG